MALFDVNFEMPEVLYHGTVIGALKGLRNKPINEEFWKNDRDFGAGFYTTIDMFQAARWARKNFITAIESLELAGIHEASFDLEQLPAIAVFSCKPANYDDNIRVLDFRGESRAWAQFILLHRYGSSAHKCLCGLHPQIVCGSMADNDTGEIIKQFHAESRSLIDNADLDWFWSQIIRTKTGERLKGLELGDQIAFFDERFNSILQLKGYYKFDPSNVMRDLSLKNYREEWTYYAEDGAPEE